MGKLLQFRKCPKCRRTGLQVKCPGCGADCQFVGSGGSSQTTKREPRIQRNQSKIIKRKRGQPEPVNRSQFVTYRDYLQSDWWKYTRKSKMRAVRNRCEECPARATQVHHLHYKTLGNESLRDLQALCAACHTHKHQAILEMDTHLDAIARGA